MERKLAWLSLMLVVCPLTVRGGTRNELVTQGSLLVRQGQRVLKVPLEQTRVRIKIAGHLAEATVTQVFINPYQQRKKGNIEAVYVFPLPVNAAVRGFVLRHGGREIRGRLLRREAARAIYRQARAAGKVAALLTQQRPNIFTQQVANLRPGQRVEVELRYASALRYDAGTYELVFPMVVGPRHARLKRGRRGAPARLSPPVLPPALRSSHDIRLQVDLESGLPLSGLRSPSHLIHLRHASASSARVTLDPRDRIPNKDFVLRFGVAGARPRAAALTHRAAAGQPGYLMLTLQPPEERFPRRVLPRELIFVLDTSSSMSGAPLAKSKQLVRRCLQNLGPDDTFQLVGFGDRVELLHTAAPGGPAMIARSARNVALALGWLRRQRAAGGTQMGAGLQAALDLPHDPARLRLVVLLTDGYITDEARLLRLVRQRAGPARVFSFGVGTAVNRYLLAELAVQGRGVAAVVRPDERPELAVDRFFTRISSPLITELSVKLLRTSGDLRLESVSPARLPDLFVGQPLRLLGRLRGAGSGALLVRGRGGSGRPLELRVPLRAVAAAHGNPALAAVWARARIAELERAMLGRDDPRLLKQVLDLALSHQLLTRHTAFVAVDQQDRDTAARPTLRVVVPVDRPRGMMESSAMGVLQTMRAGGIGASARVTVVQRSYSYRSFGSSRFHGGAVAGSGSLSLMPRRVMVRAPLISAGRTYVMGSLSKSIIRRVIRRRVNQVRYCYERQLPSSPGLRGKVVLKLVIDETSGEVTRAAISSSTLGNAEAEACIARVARAWRFPETPSGGGVVVVSYPFLLVPGNRR